MRKVLVGLVFLPFVISNFNSTSVETVVKNEASGENASVHTEITNIVNDKEVRVESDEQGEIKVEVKDGEVKVESNTQSSPTVVISDLDEEEMTEEEKEEAIEEIETIQEKIITFFDNFFSRLRTRLFFWQRY